MARLHRRLLELLTVEIVNGDQPQGAVLHETVLAERFRVSRGVAREGIRGLEDRGLVSVRHGHGAIVNPHSYWNTFDPDVLGALLAGPSAAHVLRDYLECRRILEIEAAGLAATRANEASRRALADALAQMEDHAERAATSSAAEDLFHAADLAFHEELFRATGNSSLATLANRLHAAMLTARYPLARPAYRTTRAIPEHRAILSAVLKGDSASARHAMQVHLDTIASYLVEIQTVAPTADPDVHSLLQTSGAARAT